MFPLFLNLTGRLVLVVGGGPVGRRKADAALAAGGRVRLVCLEPRPTDETNPALDWRTTPYAADHLSAPPSPSPLGRRMSTPVSSPTAGRTAFGSTPPPTPAPATSSCPPWSAAARSCWPSAPAARPRPWREIRRRLEEQFDDDFGRWAALLAEMRPLAMESVRDSERRRLLFERWARWEWLERLRREGDESVRAALLRELREACGEPPSPL